MNNRLRDFVVQIIRQQWPASGGRLPSETVQRQLLDMGEDVPEGAMTEIFDRLTDRGLIRTSTGPVNQAATLAHGAVDIIQVAPELLSR